MADYNMGPYRIRPRGKFESSARYSYLDIVNYNGSSYICNNEDLIDGISVTGVLPVGEERSPLYWDLIAEKGETGAVGPASDLYKSFETVTDGRWDFKVTDKITIPSNGSSEIEIVNVYDGCCGIIITEKELILPVNSDLSIDFNYVLKGTNQYYLYTFVYGSLESNIKRFIWNRTVINRQ